MSLFEFRFRLKGHLTNQDQNPVTKKINDRIRADARPEAISDLVHNINDDKVDLLSGFHEMHHHSDFIFDFVLCNLSEVTIKRWDTHTDYDWALDYSLFSEEFSTVAVGANRSVVCYTENDSTLKWMDIPKGMEIEHIPRDMTPPEGL